MGSELAGPPGGTTVRLNGAGYKLKPETGEGQEAAITGEGKSPKEAKQWGSLSVKNCQGGWVGMSRQGAGSVLQRCWGGGRSGTWEGLPNKFAAWQVWQLLNQGWGLGRASPSPTGVQGGWGWGLGSGHKVRGWEAH